MGGDPVTPLCSCRGIRKRPVPKPCRFNAAPNQSHAGQKTPGQKPPPAQNHAGQKAASLFRPCRWVRNHQPVPKTPGKSGSAKSPPQDAQLKSARQDALSRTARKGTRPGKRHPTNAPAKTGPRKPTRENRPERPAPHATPGKTALQTVLRTENRGKIWRSAAKPLSSHIPNDACGRAIFPPQRPIIGKSTA